MLPKKGLGVSSIKISRRREDILKGEGDVLLSTAGPVVSSNKTWVLGGITYCVAWGWFDFKPEIAAGTSKALDLLWALAIKLRRGGDLF